MTLNGEMALIFALFHPIRVRCRRRTIVRLILVYKSTFDSLWPY